MGQPLAILAGLPFFFCLALRLPPGENTLLLFDAMGREVLSQSFSDGKTVLLRDSLGAGLYFFRVENDGKVLATGKLVVK